MKCPIDPLRDKVVVERVEAKEVSDGGIFIPDEAKEKPQEGIVRAVGAGKITEQGVTVPPAVKIGDRVFFGKFSGAEIEYDGKKHLIIREDDILVIVD